MDRIIKDENNQKIKNPKGENLIIEYSFENLLKMRKRENLVKKLQALNQKKEEEKIIEDLDQVIVKKKIKKL